MIDFHVPADWQSAGLWYPVVNKDFKNVEWKRDDDLKRNFYTYDDAVAAIQLDVLEENPHAPVSLAYCFRQSDHVAFDIDLDKKLVKKAKIKGSYIHQNWRIYLPDDALRDSKIALVEHAMENHHVRWSTNGGLHVICRDPNGDIEKMAGHREKIGPSKNYLCEIIFRTILFVTSTPANNRPIVNYTPELTDWFQQVKLPTKKQSI